ncbi:TPA: LysR family transcriptional regulator [Vibrio cholerae]
MFLFFISYFSQLTESLIGLAINGRRLKLIKLPDFEAWAIFAKVAQTGSFARAATELSLSQGTVSKAITRLEGRVKSMLFHRTSRGMALTPSGELALEFANNILEMGVLAENEMTENASKMVGLVRVTAPMSFGLSHVAPALPDFMSLYPEIQLDIDFSDKQHDLIEERFDLAIRIANLSDSSFLARRLCSVRLFLVGSPTYFKKYGKPKHPSELADHRALLYTYCPNGGNWRFKHSQYGEFTQAMYAPLRVNNAEALASVLDAGLGLALQPEFLVWGDIQSGKLETVFEDWSVDPIALHLVTPPGRLRPARVQVFMDYLSDYFVDKPWAMKN